MNEELGRQRSLVKEKVQSN